MGAVLSTVPTRFLVWIDYGGNYWSWGNLGKQSDFEWRLRTGLILGCCWTPGTPKTWSNNAYKQDSNRIRLLVTRVEKQSLVDKTEGFIIDF